MPPANRKRSRVTIKDVAALAQVTDMTVSRVVNRSGPVSETLRERVLSAIDQLGYVPNRLARGLRSNRTNTIALVVTDFTNPFFTTVARGVEDAASDRDHLVLMCNTDESESEELRYLEMLSQQNVDGIILVPAKSGERAHALAQKLSIPLVILDRRVDLPGVSSVRCDSRLGASRIAKYLYDLGHRTFSILAGPVGVPTSDDRVEGFTEALKGLPTKVDVIHGKYSIDSGREHVIRAVGAHPMPTAIFALNNFIMIGALQGLQKAGIQVPRDVSLVGFDDLPTAFVAQPFLTVISQPAYDLGRQAVNELLDRLEDPSRGNRQIILETEIIVRQSVIPVSSSG